MPTVATQSVTNSARFEADVALAADSRASGNVSLADSSHLVTIEQSDGGCRTLEPPTLSMP